MYEDKDINLKEEGLMDSLAFRWTACSLRKSSVSKWLQQKSLTKTDTPNKTIKYVSERSLLES